MSLFFIRLIANRPNFAMTMTAEEQATMRAHSEYLQGLLADGTLVVAGPVMDPAGVYGMAVYEAESADAVHRLLEKDPANKIGRHEVIPMGPNSVRAPRLARP